MGKDTAIEWTNHTWNPAGGVSKCRQAAQLATCSGSCPAAAWRPRPSGLLEPWPGCPVLPVLHGGEVPRRRALTLLDPV